MVDLIDVGAGRESLRQGGGVIHFGQPNVHDDPGQQQQQKGRPVDFRQDNGEDSRECAPLRPCTKEILVSLGRFILTSRQ